MPELMKLESKQKITLFEEDERFLFVDHKYCDMAISIDKENGVIGVEDMIACASVIFPETVIKFTVEKIKGNFIRRLLKLKEIYEIVIYSTEKLNENRLALSIGWTKDKAAAQNWVDKVNAYYQEFKAASAKNN